MGEYIVRGGRVLSGEVVAGGAKNAVLPIMSAAILTRGAVLYNCPDLLDTRVCIDILRDLGCRADLYSGVLTIEPYGLTKCEISKELCGKMRSSIIFLGALAGELGEAIIYCPGGCALGKRPIDIHLKALSLMGMEITEKEDKIICRGKPKGADISLSYPSVGATENIICTAVKARGTTIIRNCAREPEIKNLADFLNSAGAKIKGAGTSEITIEGVDSLNRCEFTVMGDRIEAGTFMCAAAITGGEVFIRGIEPEYLTSVTNVIRKTGCVVKESKNLIYVDAPKSLTAVNKIITAPYPGFPTDMQPQLTAVLARAKGESRIEENIFEARYKHTHELNKMGADINVEKGKSFKIKGVERLRAANVTAEDLRGGAALILAALYAEGESRVKNAFYVQRGYEGLEEKLGAIGAEIMLLP